MEGIINIGEFIPHHRQGFFEAPSRTTFVGDGEITPMEFDGQKLRWKSLTDKINKLPSRFLFQGFLKESIQGVISYASKLSFTSCSAEVIGKKSILLGIKINDEVMVYIDIYVSKWLNHISKMFYSIYSEKICIDNGYGTVEEVFNDIFAQMAQMQNGQSAVIS